MPKDDVGSEAIFGTKQRPVHPGLVTEALWLEGDGVDAGVLVGVVVHERDSRSVVKLLFCRPVVADRGGASCPVALFGPPAEVGLACSMNQRSP